MPRILFNWFLVNFSVVDRRRQRSECVKKSLQQNVAPRKLFRKTSSEPLT